MYSMKEACVQTGVETKEMVDFLISEGCNELQGFYYYKPMEQKKFEELIS